MTCKNQILRNLTVVTLCLAAQVHASVFMGVVTHVTDGDTIWVQTTQNGAARKVRLVGMDAPESCQFGGPQASAAMTSILLHRTVQLTSRARDDYGRMLASVQLNGQDVGRWMVAQGHAWSYGYRGRAGPYAPEQAQAQSSRRGLWAQPAVEPRVFRKQHGACKH